MGMTATAIRFYTDSERLAYQKIEGMNEVLTAKASDMEDLSNKYPDAMFAIMIHEEMICRVAGIRNNQQLAFYLHTYLNRYIIPKTTARIIPCSIYALGLAQLTV